MVPDESLKKSVVIQCPNCELKMNLVKQQGEPKDACLNSLIKNFALISLVESQKNQSDKKKAEPKKYDKEKFQKEFKQGFVDESADKDKSLSSDSSVASEHGLEQEVALELP